MIRVIVADDHPLTRKGVTDVLVSRDNIEVVAEAGDGREAFEKIKHFKPDIAILDINMPEMDGIEVCRKVANAGLDTNLIIVTMYKEQEFYDEAMDVGVRGYLLKDSAVLELVECVEKVADGRHYLSGQLASFATDRLDDLSKKQQFFAQLGTVTSTERNILKLIAQDKTTNEIAEMLFISPKTVENHRGNICKKLDIHGSNALLKWVIENRLLLE